MKSWLYFFSKEELEKLPRLKWNKKDGVFYWPVIPVIIEKSNNGVFRKSN